MKVVSCRIAGRPCIVPIEQVLEITPGRGWTPMPAGTATDSAAVTAIGILSYRGRAIPVLRLQLAAAVDAAACAVTNDAASHATRLLIIGGAAGGLNSQALALEADRVDVVLEIDDAVVQPPSDVRLDHPAVTGICRIHDTLTFLIDGRALAAGRAPAGVAHE